MDALTEGRAAIVNNDLETKNAKRELLYEYFELVAAATAVHYINSTLSALNQGQTGEAFHVLSEAWAFTNALKYNPKAQDRPDADRRDHGDGLRGQRQFLECDGRRIEQSEEYTGGDLHEVGAGEG